MFNGIYFRSTRNYECNIDLFATCSITNDAIDYKIYKAYMYSTRRVLVSLGVGDTIYFAFGTFQIMFSQIEISNS